MQLYQIDTHLKGWFKLQLMLHGEHQLNKLQKGEATLLTEETTTNTPFFAIRAALQRYDFKNIKKALGKTATEEDIIKIKATYEEDIGKWNVEQLKEGDEVGKTITNLNTTTFTVIKTISWVKSSDMAKATGTKNGEITFTAAVTLLPIKR
ncbi:MAG: hypothetical protein WC595_03760 [Candidatus Nanoarchaeia archaeon]